MQTSSADVLAFPALGSSAAKVDRPYVETSVARDLQSRMMITHEERGIMLARGPWGIGKTTAIDAFAAEQTYGVAVVKVEAGPKGGASPNIILHLALEAMIRVAGYTDRAVPKYSAWVARRQICQLMEDYRQRTWDASDDPLRHGMRRRPSKRIGCDGCRAAITHRHAAGPAFTRRDRRGRQRRQPFQKMMIFPPCFAIDEVELRSFRKSAQGMITARATAFYWSW